MKNWPVIIGILFLFALTGCQKKVTKVPTTTQESVEPSAKPRTADEYKAIDISETKPEEKAVSRLSFRDVNFDFDKYDLRPDAREILAGHARLLKENPHIKILIEGHCDEWGTIEYNLALGERRANAVKNYLIRYGIEPERLSTISYGKERPLDPRHTPEAWAKNRRAAFVIID